jgi:hypothetical protein
MTAEKMMKPGRPKKNDRKREEGEAPKGKKKKVEHYS